MIPAFNVSIFVSARVGAFEYPFEKLILSIQKMKGFRVSITRSHFVTRASDEKGYELKIINTKQPHEVEEFALHLANHLLLELKQTTVIVVTPTETHILEHP